jgi:hypothetical protein
MVVLLVGTTFDKVQYQYVLREGYVKRESLQYAKHLRDEARRHEP